MWEKRNAYNVHVGKYEGERPRGTLGRTWEGNIETDMAKLSDFCKYNNEMSGSIKCGEFLDWLRKYQFLKKDFASHIEVHSSNLSFGR